MRQSQYRHIGWGQEEEPPKKAEESTLAPMGVQSHMHRNETPETIYIKFCTVVGIPNIITYINSGDHRLRGFWMVGCQIFPFPYYLSARSLHAIYADVL